MKFERISNRFLKVGRHPFKMGSKDKEDNDTRVCFCCQTNSALYSQLWPIIFLFSALTDFPMPLPEGKRPGQHRDWGWLPVLIVSCFVAYIYYGYLDRIILVLLRQPSISKTWPIVSIVLFNLFFILFIISYARMVMTEPGYATQMWKQDRPLNILDMALDEIQQNQLKPDSVLNETKWCSICQLWKPDRAHHCKVCNACVLRMDQVNGCIGVRNHRYYLQFLMYVTLFATLTFVTSLAMFVQYHGLSLFDRLALSIIILSGIIVIVVGPFTGSHIWLILINRTTIENSQFQHWNKIRQKNQSAEMKPAGFTEAGNNVFYQNCNRNWIEVMSDNKWLWFLPFSSKSEVMRLDGVHYGYNQNTLKAYLNQVSFK
ncbi:putative palmitoyltransferase ZDHHC20 [Choanephora cucurbitarum]|uniref:Palmitoyltransferase n=1 Tax=Choanephora cucurbitarum TaxID=101091 RepID=A0A1C7NPN0_9FUNG|nr:putative palmitoyltransferase ZDHHC20 [Choanephora cucurbitarum]